MSTKDVIEYDLLNEVLGGRRDREELASLLEVSERTIRRRMARIKVQGLRGMVHGNTNRKPANKRSNEERAKILGILREKYREFNVSHARDFLLKYDGIRISYGSLRELMRSLGPLKKAKRRSRKLRQHRDRMPRFGMLLQMDGSPHRWNGVDKWSLIGAIDDATSYMVHAEFFEGETTLACMRVLQKIIESQGIPRFLYVDRAGLFGGHKRQEFSQFKRACDELGIKIIFANSAQAKGRIERAWGTMQDRLVAELKFHGITEMDKANEYLASEFLPKYWNTELTVRPEQSTSEFRALPEGIDLDRILSIRFTRDMANNSTVSIDGDRYRIKAPPGERVPLCSRAEIIISQDGLMRARIREESFPLEKIRTPRKEPMRCMEPCAKRRASEAPGEGTLWEGPPQVRAQAKPAPVPHAHGSSSCAGGECPTPPLGARIGDEIISVLNPHKIPPKRKMDKVA